MKTLAEIKDEVAKTVGFDTWEQFAWNCQTELGYVEKQMDYVAKAYAEQAIEQCAKEVELWHDGYDFEPDSTIINPNSILNIKSQLK